MVDPRVISRGSRSTSIDCQADAKLHRENSSEDRKFQICWWRGTWRFRSGKREKTGEERAISSIQHEALDLSACDAEADY
jgi:hypothetical protein